MKTRARWWIAPTQTHLAPELPAQGKPTVYCRAVGVDEESTLTIQGETHTARGPMSAQQVADWFRARFGWAAEFKAKSKSADFVIEPMTDGFFMQGSGADEKARLVVNVKKATDCAD